jgi:RNA methyltransferase, TrmH family
MIHRITRQCVLLGMVSVSELKFIRSLKIKKYRIREQSFLVEGRKNVQELLQSGFEVRLVLATPDYLKKYGGQFPANVPVREVPAKTLGSISTLTTNDEVLAIARMRELSLTDLHSGFLMALDGVRDPGNLGTIIRTLDWFGFDQLLCSPDSVDLYNPKVISATMGSFSRVRVVYAPIEEYLHSSKRESYGADMNGKSLDKVEFNPSGILLLGSESHGINERLLTRVGTLVAIPGRGKAESLNVGVAAGIFCNHLSSILPGPGHQAGG